MASDWIMNARADASAFQKLRQRIAPLGPDDIHVINCASPRSLRRNLHRAFQTTVVTRRNVPAVLVQFVDVAQLDPADRRLNFVETKIVADELMHILRPL